MNRRMGRRFIDFKELQVKRILKLAVTIALNVGEVQAFTISLSLCRLWIRPYLL